MGLLWGLKPEKKARLHKEKPWDCEATDKAETGEKESRKIIKARQEKPGEGERKTWKG